MKKETQEEFKKHLDEIYSILCPHMCSVCCINLDIPKIMMILNNATKDPTACRLDFKIKLQSVEERVKIKMLVWRDDNADY